MIVKSEAIILKSIKYGESSKILTLLTDRYGKMSVIAKGVRGPKSKFGSLLEPMNHVSAVFYRKETRELQLLSQCDLMGYFPRVHEDVEKMGTAMGVIELASFASHQEESGPLFHAVLDTLQTINDATKDIAIALYVYELRVLEILGFRPSFHMCAHCSRPIEERNPPGTFPGRFQLGYGGIVCPSCAMQGGATRRISRDAVQVFRALQEEGGLQTDLSEEVRGEIHGILKDLLREHISGFHGLKSESVFAAMQM